MSVSHVILVSLILCFYDYYDRLQGRVSIDHKCSSYGCWYCKKSCHICMEDANQGYTLFLSEGHSETIMLKHCGEDCKTVIDKAPHFSVEIIPMLIHACDEEYLVLLSSEGCFSSHLSSYTVMHVTVCVSMKSVSIVQGKPFAIFQLRSTKQQVLFAAYLSDDFSLIEPVYEFPQQAGFSRDVQESTFSQVLEKSLHDKGVLSISQLLVTAMKVDVSIAKYFSISLGQSNTRYVYDYPQFDYNLSTFYTRLYDEDTLETANRISHEESFTKWMVEHTTACTITCKHKHQSQLPTLNTHSTYLPLLPLSCTLGYLFWIYFQSTCTLWKEVLINGQIVNESLDKKVAHALQVTTMIYEQSPQDVQNDIIRNFSLSSDILVMCRVGVTTCEGIAYLLLS